MSIALVAGATVVRKARSADVSPGKKFLDKIPSQFLGVDTTNIIKTGNMFEGVEFCVLYGDLEHSKQDLETLVAQFGGTFVQNPIKSTTNMVVVGRESS